MNKNSYILIALILGVSAGWALARFGNDGRSGAHASPPRAAASAASSSSVTPAAHGQQPATGTRHPSHDGPCATFPVDVKALGKVDAGSSIPFAFPIKNAGKQVLTVSSVQGSCGCVSADFPRTLEPGASGEIKGTFEPNLFWSGEMDKTLTVATNDPKLPEAILKFTADVIPFVKMEPRSPLVVQFRPGQVLEREIKLTPRGDTTLKLSPEAGESGMIKAALEPLSVKAPPYTYRLKMKITAPKEPGDFNTSFRLSTSHRDVTKVPIVVVGLALEGPVVSPRQVFVSTMSAQQTGLELRKLQVFTRSGNLKLLSAETDIKGLKLETKTKSEGRSYEVTARYLGGWKSGGVDGEIRLKTDDKSHPVLKVPFSATVQ